MMQTGERQNAQKNSLHGPPDLGFRLYSVLRIFQPNRALGIPNTVSYAACMKNMLGWVFRTKGTILRTVEQKLGISC